MGQMQVESPIEDALADAFGSIDDDRLRFSRAKSLETFKLTLATDWQSQRIFVASQVRIGDYRVDFLLGVFRGVAPKLLAIECDGHQFHRANQNQIERDSERDSHLRILGVPTMRFSGSQIVRDQWSCARRAINMIAPRPETSGFEPVHCYLHAALTPRDTRWNDWSPASKKQS